jgi:uncharacterized protein (TIGR02285 family)
MTMPPRLRAAAAVVLAAALLHPASAQPQPAASSAGAEVQWLRYELPPLYITQGPQKDEGLLDRLLRDALLPRLPGFQHRVVAVPPKRLEASLQKLPNSCAFGLLKNAEREAYLYFSRPFPIRVSPLLVVRRQDLPRWQALIDDQGRLPLTQWLARPDTRLGHAPGRAYGATLDALVAAQPPARVEQVTSENPALNLMLMLQRGRIDGMLALPFELPQLTRESGMDGDELRLLPLVEQGAARQGHVACARSALGAEVVRRADVVLAEAPFKDGVSLPKRRTAPP